jgi:MFS family permease
VREGITFVWRNRPLRLIVGSTAVIGVVGFNMRVLIPVLTSKTLHAGAHVLGLLFAFFGLGALVGALFTASLERPRWRYLLAGLLGLGVAMIVIGLVPSVWSSALLLAVVGLCFSLWSATAQSILQLSAPDELRGRVISLFLFFFAGLAPIGSLLTGWLADVGGTRLAFLVAGGSAVAAGTYCAARLRAPQDPPGRSTAYLDLSV